MCPAQISHQLVNSPARDFPPWGYASSPELAHMLGVSLQTIFNRRLRRQLPPSVQCRSRRHYYRLADILAQSSGTNPQQIIIDWINSRFPGLIDWAKRQGQDQSLDATLDRTIAFLERIRAVPLMRKPRGSHVPKFSTPLQEDIRLAVQCRK